MTDKSGWLVNSQQLGVFVNHLEEFSHTGTKTDFGDLETRKEGLDANCPDSLELKIQAEFIEPTRHNQWPEGDWWGWVD
jgi:hypothetical protein